MQKGFVTILILSIIVGLFAISNSGVVTIDFIFTEVMLSQAIVIFICVLIGAILASVFGYTRQLSIKKKNKQLEKENEIAKAKVEELEVEMEVFKKELKDAEKELEVFTPEKISE